MSPAEAKKLLTIAVAIPEENRAIPLIDGLSIAAANIFMEENVSDLLPWVHWHRYTYVAMARAGYIDHGDWSNLDSSGDVYLVHELFKTIPVEELYKGAELLREAINLIPVLIKGITEAKS